MKKSKGLLLYKNKLCRNLLLIPDSATHFITAISLPIWDFVVSLYKFLVRDKEGKIELNTWADKLVLLNLKLFYSAESDLECGK